jgi:acetylornithine/succinyldiaminopimelate/putrescine aminotransferase
MSKRVQSYVECIYSPLVDHGDEKNLVMCGGETLLDTVSGLGSNLWECANNYSLECVESVILAEEILKNIPYHQKIKYTKTGSAACEASVRYARAFTKRDRIAYTGYHGCSNVFVNCTPPALGTVYEMSQKFSTIEELTDFVEAKPGLAAVIIEPLELDTYALAYNLHRLQQACNVDGCLLIYDEIITGWRVPSYTMANWTEVYPDVSVLGKALGGGHALGIVAVTDEIAAATQGVFISNTHNGEQCALRAAISVICKTTLGDIDRMWAYSKDFQEQVNKLRPELVFLKGYPARYIWECSSDTMKALIWQEMYKQGILCGAAFFPKLSWGVVDYERILECLKLALEGVENKLLHGLPPRPFFKRV